MTKNIYLVARGEYSDYTIEAVFDTIEEAEAYAIHFVEGRVETFELNKKDNYPQGKAIYYVYMTRDGEVIYCHKCNPEYTQLKDWAFLWSKPYETKQEALLCRTFWTKSKEHAIKIVNDKRAEILFTYGFPEKTDFEEKHYTSGGTYTDPIPLKTWTQKQENNNA